MWRRPHAIDDATRTGGNVSHFDPSVSRLPLLRGRVGVQAKKTIQGRLQMHRCCAHAQTGIHRVASSCTRHHDTAARPVHAARALAHLPRHRFGCPPTIAGPAAALGAAHWYGDRARWPRTGHAQHAPRRSLRAVGWLVIGSKPERVGASRQQVETQRYWSSGRHDITGCLRPCLIAYIVFSRYGL